MKKAIVSIAVAAIVCCALQPVFAAVTEDQHWDNQFGPPGVNSQTFGIAVIGTNVFTGGSISTAGGTRANGVAGFNGTTWFPLNSGLLGSPPPAVVICLIADGNDL